MTFECSYILFPKFLPNFIENKNKCSKLKVIIFYLCITEDYGVRPEIFNHLKTKRRLLYL